MPIEFIISIPPEVAEELSERIDAVIDAPDDAAFSELARLAGLDPKEDFKRTDLSGFLFQEGEDIRGFDFTGADLIGANPHVALVDHTTIFTGADMHDHVRESLREKGATVDPAPVRDADVSKRAATQNKKPRRHVLQ